jgi:hypothetical protein
MVMQSKISVILLKSKVVDNSSDLNKMVVHLEQLLAEKDGVDLKVRQSVTDALTKSSDFVIFCGYDTSTLSEFFKTLSIIEGMEGTDGPCVFLYEEPGQSPWERINYLLRDCMDLGRTNPKVFDKVISTWSYRDIVSTIEVSLRRLGTGSISSSSASVK